MHEERTWTLIAHKLAGSATNEEWLELQQKIRDKPEIGFYLQALTNFWYRHAQYDKEKIEEAIKRVAEVAAKKNEITDTDSSALRVKDTQRLLSSDESGKKSDHYLHGLMKRLHNYLATVWREIAGRKKYTKA